MTISGMDEIIAGLERAKRDILDAVARGVQKTAESVLQNAKDLTAHPFQEVPSYLLLHKFQPELASRVYPKDTAATFANRTSGKQRLGNLKLFVGEDESLPVQEFPSGAHHLHEDIELREARVRDTQVSAVVGYPGGVPDYVKWVLFGTRGHRGPRGRRVGAMVPRPFLDDALSEVGSGGMRSEFVTNVLEEVKTVLGEK